MKTGMREKEKPAIYKTLIIYKIKGVIRKKRKMKDGEKIKIKSFLRKDVILILRVILVPKLDIKLPSVEEK